QQTVRHDMTENDHPLGHVPKGGIADPEGFGIRGVRRHWRKSPMKISAGIAMTGCARSSSDAIESMISFATQNHSRRKAGRMSPHRAPAWTRNMTLNP